jgi:flavodoxin I
MKYLVTYWSQTGNTKKVAEAIYEALPGEKNLKSYDAVENLDGFDLTFIGFPIMQFGPPPAAKKFLATQAPGKKIVIFITHATLSDSDDAQQQIMLEKELEKCRSACSGSELLGLYHCQGELSEKMAGQLISSNIPMLMEFAAMRPLTIGHPDKEELAQAQVFARKFIATEPDQ